MKSYIGSKIIKAEPMDKVSFEESQYPEKHYGGENCQGYKVYYPDGYISWSPKEVFETCYREITESEKKLV